MDFFKCLWQLEKRADKFGNLRKLHQILGLKPRTRFFQRIWPVCAVLMAIHLALYVHRLCVVIHGGFGVLYITTSIYIILTSGSGVISVISLHLHYDNFEVLQDFFNANTFRSSSRTLQSIRHAQAIDNQKFSLIVPTLGGCNAIAFVMTAYRTTDKYNLAFEIPWVGERVHLAIDLSCGLIMMISNVYFFTPLITTRNLLKLFIIELQIVNDSFQQLYEHTERCVNDVEARLSTVSQFQREAIFWHIFEATLKEIIEYHAKLLGCIEHMKRLASVPFLAILTATMFLLSIICLLITFDFTETYMVFTFTVIVVSVCYYSASLSEELMQKHGETVAAIYNMEWITLMAPAPPHVAAYKAVRANLLLTMMRAQKGLQMRSGMLFTMSKDTFTATIKASYSILMFMINSK